MIMKKHFQQTNFQAGDVVKVRKGLKDPETEVDMGDWYGRIMQFFELFSLYTGRLQMF
jgi:hypothetical protein